MGEALYTQLFFFTNCELLVDAKYQKRIKEYLYCKTFNCPPYPTLQESPANIIDEFMIIDEEYKLCERNQNSKENKGSKS